MALQKKEEFEEGAFVIEDENNRLLNYLRKCPGAAKRDSSHFMGRSPRSWLSALHFGLDVFNKDMPAKKRTLDFVDIDAYEQNKKHLFIKPENYSPFITNYYDFTMMSVRVSSCFGKKNVRVMAAMISQADRKERVPDDAKKAFTKLISLLPKDQLQFETNRGAVNLADLKNNASKWGIAFMNDCAERWLKGNPQGELEERNFQRLLKSL